MRLSVTAAFVALASSATAQTYRAENNLNVNPVSASRFEVIEANGEGPRGMFCAAASYAERRLGVRGGRVYVFSARGPSKTVPGRKGVVFTVDPSDVTPVSGYSVSLKQVGYGLPVGHARQFCKDYIESDDYEWELGE